MLENDQKKIAKSKPGTSHVLYRQFYDYLKRGNELKKKLVLSVKFKEFQLKSYMAGIQSIIMSGLCVENVKFEI